MTRPGVLVVEDDPALARNMAEILAALDVRTVVAGSVAEALERSTAQPFDVAILDVVLPDGDGLSLLRELQRRDPDTEAVFVTGHATLDNAAAAVRARVADFVVKPFTPDRLRDSVRTALDRKRAHDAILRDERLAAVANLAAGLGHELRNPLNAALLKLAVIRRQVRSTEVVPGASGVCKAIQAHLDVTEDELRRLARIVTDFEACLTPIEPAVSTRSIDELLRVAQEDIRPAASAAGVTVNVETDVDLPDVRFDFDAIRRVLRNLTQNAVEAMPTGGTLTLRARRGHDEVELDVEDTGPGVADDRVIFDPFFTTKPTGTGLGLTIAKRIVTDHGGTMSVTSSPGSACFTIALPAEPITTT